MLKFYSQSVLYVGKLAPPTEPDTLQQKINYTQSAELRDLSAVSREVSPSTSFNSFPITTTFTGQKICVTPSGPGICKSINDCPVVRQNLANQQPKTCGFQGRIPIVCCPRDPIHIGDNSPPATDFECGTAFQEVIPTVNVPSRSRRFITNGRVSTRNAWPWMALLGQDRGGSRFWFCSGVVLNRRWILTAAHCTNRLNVTWVRLGEHDHRIDDDGVQVEDVRVADVIYHPGYQPPEAYHDISLIRLARPLKLKDYQNASRVLLSVGEEVLSMEAGWMDYCYWGSQEMTATLSVRFSSDDVNGFGHPSGMCLNYGFPINYLSHSHTFTARSVAWAENE
ncbi:unnamed protein product, partial [Meganyctiphanes norvegica]